MEKYSKNERPNINQERFFAMREKQNYSTKLCLIISPIVLKYTKKMGLFNTLYAPVSCPSCTQSYTAKLQFKFGATRQLEYHLSDKLIWGYNEIGMPHLQKVSVYAILENSICPICGVERLEYQDEFDIRVENDVLVAVEEMKDYSIYLADPKAEGCYAVL